MTGIYFAHALHNSCFSFLIALVVTSSAYLLILNHKETTSKVYPASTMFTAPFVFFFFLPSFFPLPPCLSLSLSLFLFSFPSLPFSFSFFLFLYCCVYIIRVTILGNFPRTVLFCSFLPGIYLW